MYAEFIRYTYIATIISNVHTGNDVHRNHTTNKQTIDFHMHLEITETVAIKSV